MTMLALRDAPATGPEMVSLGEVMLRLDPGEERIHTTRTFRAWEGGGEYNVARGLRRVFGLRTAVATAIVDNPVGRLLEDLILAGGVDQRYVRWVPFDGLGKRARVGLNFTERGFGVRSAVGVSDRGQSAASQMAPGDIDWDRVFGEDGVRWLHTGGIFAGLSDGTAALTREAMEAARRHGAMVSFDLNFRPSLWADHGGPAAAQAVNRGLAGLVDVMIGNEEDYATALGFEVEGANADFSGLDPDAYGAMLRRVREAYPNARVLAATLRTATTASRNDWGAVALAGDELAVSRQYEGLEILDRIGGGDSFASGLVYGLLTGGGIQRAVDLGVAHGALAMTTPGDTSMATLAEVERVAKGGTARVVR
jgi:2-dehydro-3-deoxygluconokinase